MQSVTPWCSSEDIAKGSRGLDDIAQNLDKANFGIVCLTPNNLSSGWINFEAGALSKKFGHSALFTFLLDLQPADIKPPLGLFQHTHPTETDVFRLVQAINAKTEKPLSMEILNPTYKALWPKLDAELQSLPVEASPSTTTRPEREILEEILSTVRGQSQKAPTNPRSDLFRRRISSLLNFAEGSLKTRGHEPKVNAKSLGEDEAVLLITLNGEVHEIVVRADAPMDQTKAEVVDLAKRIISDDDIPF